MSKMTIVEKEARLFKILSLMGEISTGCHQVINPSSIIELLKTHQATLISTKEGYYWRYSGMEKLDVYNIEYWKADNINYLKYFYFKIIDGSLRLRFILKDCGGGHNNDDPKIIWECEISLPDSYIITIEIPIMGRFAEYVEREYKSYLSKQESDWKKNFVENILGE